MENLLRTEVHDPKQSKTKEPQLVLGAYAMKKKSPANKIIVIIAGSSLIGLILGVLGTITYVVVRL